MIASFRRRGVLVRDQPFGAGDRVVPGVRLGRLVAGLVPVLTVLAAAAHVRDGKHAAAVEPGQKGRPVERRLRDAVGAVAIEDGRIAAVELDALPCTRSTAARACRRRLDLDLRRGRGSADCRTCPAAGARCRRPSSAGLVGVVAAEARPGSQVEHRAGAARIRRQRVDVAGKRQLDRHRLRARRVGHAQHVARRRHSSAARRAHPSPRQSR